jgi:DNA-binding GntR family transcriptional regulator
MHQREHAYNTIRNAITYGELKPGERLIEKRLCEIFKLGRTPLREALSQLQIEGYLDFVPNKGLTISRISYKSAEEIYYVLARLESSAAELATTFLDRENEKELRLIQNELEEAWVAKNYKEWMNKNALFHEYFAKASGNDFLYKLIGSLRNRIYRYRVIAVTIPGSVNEYFQNHVEILDAVSRKEAKQTGDAMYRHVCLVGEKLVEFLKHVPWL